MTTKRIKYLDILKEQFMNSPYQQPVLQQQNQTPIQNPQMMNPQVPDPTLNQPGQPGVPEPIPGQQQIQPLIVQPEQQNLEDELNIPEEGLSPDDEKIEKYNESAIVSYLNRIQEQNPTISDPQRQPIDAPTVEDAIIKQEEENLKELFNIGQIILGKRR